MKNIRDIVISLAFAAVLSIQGWVLVEVVNLKIEVARLGERVALHNRTANNDQDQNRTR